MMLRAMLIATVLSLGALGQPKEAICSNCYNACYIAGGYCGFNCVCGCHGYQCACFAVYTVPQAETDGYTFE